VVPFPPGAGDSAVDIKINAGVNSWGYETFFSGSQTFAVNRLYGDTT